MDNSTERDLSLVYKRRTLDHMYILSHVTLLWLNEICFPDLVCQSLTQSEFKRLELTARSQLDTPPSCIYTIHSLLAFCVTRQSS